MVAQISKGGEYNLALLRLMAELRRTKTSEAVAEFERRLGHLIPTEHHEVNPSGNLRWEWRVRWARQDLVEAGLMGSAGHGIWTITEAGLQWLQDNPNAISLSPARRGAPDARGSHKRPTSSRRKPTAKPDRPAGITLQQLEKTRAAMPGKEFRQLWGHLYDQLLAQDRAKATTSISQAELGNRARRELDRIHSYLQGRHAEPPDARRICLWIEFCYALQLHREAASLFRYLDANEVDAAIYGQVKRLAAASKSKLGW